MSTSVDPRTERAAKIAATPGMVKILREGAEVVGYKVRSSNGSDDYTVSPKFWCGCPDNKYRPEVRKAGGCKHVRAVKAIVAAIEKAREALAVGTIENLEADALAMRINFSDRSSEFHRNSAEILYRACQWVRNEVAATAATAVAKAA